MQQKTPGRKYKVRRFLFFFILLLPFWSVLVWFVWPKQKLQVFIYDKTVPAFPAQEHESLSWVLNHNKIVQDNNKLYRPRKDYWGFIPVAQDSFFIRDLEGFRDKQLDSIATRTDIAFFADAYGVYANEWYDKHLQNERSSLVYGALTMNDLSFMEKLRERNKLIFGEFNLLGSPTEQAEKQRGEFFFGLETKGYTMRYYEELNPALNRDVPNWMLRNYKQYHKKDWSFSGEGVVLVSENGEIDVLRAGKELTHALPIIESDSSIIKSYGVAQYVRYPYWIEYNRAFNPNTVHAYFRLHTTEDGKAMLNKHGLESRFPAVIRVRENIHYFCGDFSDNPVLGWTAFFKGSHFFRQLFYDNRDYSKRSKFFWEFYRPYVENAINEYVNGY